MHKLEKGGLVLSSRREIYSPCSGRVKEMLVDKDDFIYEWESIAIVEKFNGEKVSVQLSSSGYIKEINTKQGSTVEENTLLGYIEEDTFPCGAD